jgi:hypothetical protein
MNKEYITYLWSSEVREPSPKEALRVGCISLILLVIILSIIAVELLIL